MVDRFTAGMIVDKWVERAGTTSRIPEVQHGLQAAVAALPFRILAWQAIASNGESTVREVAVISAQVQNNAGETTTRVIKIGKSYDEDIGEDPFSRSHKESKFSQMASKSHLAAVTVDSHSLIGGFDGSMIDIRVQDLVEGVPLRDINLLTLGPEDIKALSSYHLALLKTLLKDNFWPEPGYLFKRKNFLHRVATWIMLGIPMVSQNSIYDKATTQVSLVDSGFPVNIHEFSGVTKIAMKTIYASMIAAQCFFLTAWDAINSIKTLNLKIGNAKQNEADARIAT